MIDTNFSMNNPAYFTLNHSVRQIKRRLRRLEVRLEQQERHIQARLQQQVALQQRGREEILNFLCADQQRQEQLMIFLQQHQTKIVNEYREMEELLIRQQQRIDRFLQPRPHLQNQATAEQAPDASNINTPSGSNDHAMIEDPDLSDVEIK